MFGYSGKILHVDMTTRKYTTRSITEELCKKYIGGLGLVARLLYENHKPKIDPLSPDNTLIFATGPFAGTMVPTGSKCGVGAKSPLTGFIGESVTTSFWSHELKAAGYDAIVIKGRSVKPTYLFINDHIVQFRDAKDLWGKSCLETEELIREEIGNEAVRVAAIGLAGENLVRYACILNDAARRAAGRTGLGAVMGSKNLKAVAIFGTRTIQVADIDKLMEVYYDFKEKCQGTATQKYRVLGTPQNVLPFNRLGCLPTRNFQQSTFEGAENVSGELMLEKYVTRVAACDSCPIACEHHVVVNEGPYTSDQSVSIDYESLWAFGPNCGIDDFPGIIKAIELCDFYGLDTISAGVVAGWAMECYEKGLMTKGQVDGLDLKFGNHAACVQLLHKIARRQGVGDLLAEGVKRASEKVGKGSDHFAMHIKGLELPGYDIRSLKTLALGLAVAARGGCHNRSGAYSADISGKVDRFKAEKGRGMIAADSEDYYAVFDSVGMCKFTRRVFKDFYAEVARLYTLVTGFKMESNDLIKTGERIINLKKMYNIREGWTRKDDSLPLRVLRDPVPSGPAKGSFVTQDEINLMLDDYYEARGWMREGVPTREKLTDLGLSDVVKNVGK